MNEVRVKNVVVFMPMYFGGMQAFMILRDVDVGGWVSEFECDLEINE